VQPALEAAFGEQELPIRRAALRSLARLGGEPAERTLRAALAASENSLVAIALESLAERPRPELAPAVSAILTDPVRAGRHWRGLIAWYRAAPANLTPTDLGRLIAVAERAELPRPQAAELLESLASFRAPASREVNEQLARIAQVPPREVAEAAAICLARWGDRNAKRTLVKRYDDLVDRNKDDPAILAQRGRIHLRLGDGALAATDLKRAIDMAEAANHDLARSDAWVDLARAYVATARMQAASEALGKAQLDAKARAALAADPSFAALVANSRYGRILREP
jgi:tetratricopeptide (TPR) repeat protein